MNDVYNRSQCFSSSTNISLKDFQFNTLSMPTATHVDDCVSVRRIGCCLRWYRHWPPHLGSFATPANMSCLVPHVRHILQLRLSDINVRRANYRPCISYRAIGWLQMIERPWNLFKLQHSRSECRVDVAAISILLDPFLRSIRIFLISSSLLEFVGVFASRRSQVCSIFCFVCQWIYVSPLVFILHNIDCAISFAVES